MPIALPPQPYAWPAGSSLTEQQRFARAQCMASFADQIYVNSASGDRLTVTGRGIKHSLRQAQQPLMRALWMLPQAIVEATPMGVFADKLGRPDILSAHKYQIEFDDGGCPLIGQIVAREISGAKGTTYLQFYDLAVLKL